MESWLVVPLIIYDCIIACKEQKIERGLQFL